jgi:hypothetical protein
VSLGLGSRDGLAHARDTPCSLTSRPDDPEYYGLHRSRTLLPWLLMYIRPVRMFRWLLFGVG